MHGPTVPARLPRPSAPVAVVMAAVATMAVVAIAYAGPVSTSVPGAITFGPGARPVHSTMAALAEDRTADAPPAAGPSASPAAGRTQESGTTAVGPLRGLIFSAGVGAGTIPRPSTTDAPAAGERTSPAQIMGPAVTATVTHPLSGHTAGSAPSATPAATLVAPAPPVTTGHPQPAATNADRASAASPDQNRTGGNGTGGGASNSGSRQPSGAGHGSDPAPAGVTPTVVAPDYPVVSAQAVRQSGSPPKHSGQGHSKGH